MTLRAPKILLLAALVLAGVPACAPMHLVEIDSRPLETRGATIYVNGERRGVTPAKVEIRFTGKPEERTLIQVVKPNYRSSFQYWTLLEVPEKRAFDLEDE